MPPRHIILANDHAIVRESLRLLLEGDGYIVVGEASDGTEAVALAGKIFSHIVIMDIGMPVMNGVDAAREILRVSPNTKVVMLSMYAEDYNVVRALKAGVSGYVLKTQAAVDLIQALRDVEVGRIYLSSGISRTVVQRMLNRDYSDPDVLSPRELQVLQLIAEGFPTKVIASKLFVSPRTIESHRTSLMQKANVSNAAGLVLYAIRRGLVEP